LLNLVKSKRLTCPGSGAGFTWLAPTLPDGAAALFLGEGVVEGVFTPQVCCAATRDRRVEGSQVTVHLPHVCRKQDSHCLIHYLPLKKLFVFPYISAAPHSPLQQIHFHGYVT